MPRLVPFEDPRGRRVCGRSEGVGEYGEVGLVEWEVEGEGVGEEEGEG